MKVVPTFTGRSLLVPALLGGLLTAGGLLVTLDAARQRAHRGESEPDVRTVVRLLGTADMALSSASRWLRHPSLSEPGAAFADAPAILDADPAGAMIAPPRDLLAGANAAVLPVSAPDATAASRSVAALSMPTESSRVKGRVFP